MEKLRVIQGGRSNAERFEALVGPHYDALYRVAYRLVRSVPDAEDLVQEVCVRAFPRLDELAELDDPRGWMLCVMRRIFIDQTRRYERRHVQSMESVEEILLASDRPGPADEAESLVQEQKLDRAWQHLDGDQRSLLALHDIEGYSLVELVEMTGIKEGTLKSKLHRARVKLGRLLKAEMPAAVPRSGTSL